MNLNRFNALIGETKLNEIKNLNIFIVGIGGVGGYTLESLVRSGIENITIVDYDKIEDTNLNRQIISNENNIGKYKVDEAYTRYSSINKDLKLNTSKIKIDSKSIIEIMNDNSFDYIVDACDDINAKVELIKYSVKNNIKIISCMGTAKKLDPSKIEITRLDKTEYDPLAKRLRNILRKENISLKIPVVYSKENSIKSEILGSCSFVQGVAGLYITSYIINDVINEKKN